MFKNITKNSIVFSFILIFSLVFSNLAMASEARSSDTSRSNNATNISNASRNDAPTGNEGAPVLSTPSIISTSAQNITSTTATYTGSVNPNGASTNAWFENSNGKIFASQKIGNSTNTINLNSYNISGLSPNTKYSFRIVATNSLGTTYGNWVMFYTSNYQNNSPVVVSTQVNKITQTSAVLSGSVNPKGSTVIAYFENSSGKIFNSQKISSANATVNLNSYALTGLTPNTTYKIRIVIKDSNSNLSTVYGPWVSFTTLSNGNGGGNGGGGGGGYVYVYPTTINATNITKNSVILNGSVATHNLATTAWFEYGTSNNVSTFTSTLHQSVNGANNSTPFSKSVYNLNPNTTYYFRIVASGPSGTRYGNVLSFTTQANIKPNPNPNIDPTPINEEYENITDNNINQEDIFNGQNENYLTASVLFGNGKFLPDTFLGWVLILIIIVLIILIIREIIKTFHKKKSKEISADHIENLPM